MLNTVTPIQCTPFWYFVKGKFSAGYDEIPEYVVKQCEKFVKGPLAHI